jgi:sulfite reductase (NADPH) hemoprotein beta-component
MAAHRFRATLWTSSWNLILNYSAVVRAYNRFVHATTQGPHQDLLVKAEGQQFIDQVEAEYQAIVEVDGTRTTITRRWTGVRLLLRHHPAAHRVRRALP